VAIPPRSTLDEAALDQKGFVDVLNGVLFSLMALLKVSTPAGYLGFFDNGA
jgi:hypothetical protein